MTDGLVILGGVVFQDHEIPATINIGGKQRLKVHNIVGNTRVVDAMGPDPDDKKWSGRFRGASAIGRAQAVDAMRISGAQVSLSWLGLFYTVVVKEFRADTEKYYEVPYQITVTVVDDPGQDGSGGGGGSLDSLVGDDFSMVGSILSSPPQSVSTAFSALGSAIDDDTAPLASASQATLAPITAAANTLSSSLDDALSSASAPLDTPSPDGSDPSASAAWVSAMAGAAASATNLADASGYAARLALNLQLASSQ